MAAISNDNEVEESEKQFILEYFLQGFTYEITNASSYAIEEWHLLAWGKCLLRSIYFFSLLNILSNSIITTKINPVAPP